MKDKKGKAEATTSGNGMMVEKTSGMMIDLKGMMKEATDRGDLNRCSREKTRTTGW